ncbi:MAG TPA: hypothetical protein VGG39_18965 [Polyangiaceae bacterium]|jgi:hypothetical protein
MSSRKHFWLRVVGLALILAAEFGPRLWSTSTQGPSAPAMTAAITR